MDRHRLDRGASPRGADRRFYFATGIHPDTGKHYPLEGSTDFGDRVNVVAEFHLDPMISRQHLGLNMFQWPAAVQIEDQAR